MESTKAQEDMNMSTKPMKPVKIEKKIVSYAVHKPKLETEVVAAEVVKQPVEMNETIERPEFLLGSTYKIKPPVSEHAFLYHDQRHHVERRHRSREPTALRDLHQLKVDGTLSMGHRSNACYIGRLQKRG